jgi:hypothetical protein
MKDDKILKDLKRENELKIGKKIKKKGVKSRL